MSQACRGGVAKMSRCIASVSRACRGHVVGMLWGRVTGVSQVCRGVSLGQPPTYYDHGSCAINPSID